MLMEERQTFFRKSLVDPKTGGLDLFRVIGAMHTPSDEGDGWHKSLTQTAGTLAVIIREGVDSMRADVPAYVFRPRNLRDLLSVAHLQVTHRLGLKRTWLEMDELARALPAYLGLKDERRWWLSELRGFCSDSLPETLKRFDMECGMETGDDFLVRCYAVMLSNAFSMLTYTVFGRDMTDIYINERPYKKTTNWRDDLTEALAKSERPL